MGRKRRKAEQERKQAEKLARQFEMKADGVQRTLNPERKPKGNGYAAKKWEKIYGAG